MDSGLWWCATQGEQTLSAGSSTAHCNSLVQLRVFSAQVKQLQDKVLGCERVEPPTWGAPAGMRAELQETPSHLNSGWMKMRLSHFFSLRNVTLLLKNVDQHNTQHCPSAR